MPIALDTNVLLRLAERDDPLHPSVRVALKYLRDKDEHFCFFPQNVAEFWNVCTRPTTARGGFGLSVEETNRRVRLLHRLFEIYYEVPAAYRQWHDLVMGMQLKGIQVHDARIVALMLTHGIQRILTFNSDDFQRYAGIEALSPQELS